MACSRFVGVIIGSSLLISSTGAVAAANPAPVQQVNPWAALAVMSGSAPAAVLCGSAAATAAAAAAATAQPAAGCVLPAVDSAPVAAAEPPAPIPVPPVETVGGGFGVSPLLLGLAAVLLGVGAYLLIRKHENSPA